MTIWDVKFFLTNEGARHGLVNPTLFENLKHLLGRRFPLFDYHEHQARHVLSVLNPILWIVYLQISKNAIEVAWVCCFI